jgi:hypothetical protein
MKVTRRDLFVWGAGAAAGLVFTPLPWKLLDDVSIWTQNWPWIPQPQRGPVEIKQSFCGLCPQGCAVKVKTTGGFAVGIAGVTTNPLTRGALCPLAFAVHQLNWHPQRLRAVQHNGAPSSWGDAHSAFAQACSEGPVAIIDGHPGRAASAILARFAQTHNGTYRIAMTPETRALVPYESWTGVPAFSLGYDLENVRTLVSFGAPLLDGWGIPGRFTRMWAERAAGMTDTPLRLIQIEDSLSHTASRAWKWISIRPDSESALAAGLARSLMEEKLVPTHAPIPRITVCDAATQAGITEDAVRDLAHTIIERPPVLAIASDHNPQIAALNAVLGAVGARGGILRKSKSVDKCIPAAGKISNVRAILLDSSVPWDFTPDSDAEIFRFAAWDGGSQKSGWLLSAPGFLEELTDIPTPPTSAVETYAIASPQAKPHFGIQSSAQFLASLDPALPTVKKVIHDRCVDLFRRRHGTVYGPEVTSVARFNSAQSLEAELGKASIWVGDPPSPGGLKCELQEWPPAITAETRQNWASAWNAPVMPPLATKLYRESNLREAPDRRTA